MEEGRILIFTGENKPKHISPWPRFFRGEGSETGFLCVSLTVLKLTWQTRLVWKVHLRSQDKKKQWRFQKLGDGVVMYDRGD